MAVNEKAPPLFRGAATALITPFRNGDVDFTALGALIDAQIDAGIDALVVLGTTGEASTLTERERSEVIRFAAVRVGGRIPLIAGTGTNDTVRTVRYTREARAMGADAALVVTPYYNKGTREGIVSHYREAAAVGIPVIVYNVPSRTGVRLTPDDYTALAELDGIVGIKEAGGELSVAAMTALRTRHKLALYSGNDSETLPFLSLGGDGVISVLSNLFPHEVHLMCRRFLEGDSDGARTLFYRYLPLVELLFAEPNPVCVKYAMSLHAGLSPELRLPLTEPTRHTQNLLCRALADLADGCSGI